MTRPPARKCPVPPTIRVDWPLRRRAQLPRLRTQDRGGLARRRSLLPGAAVSPLSCSNLLAVWRRPARCTMGLWAEAQVWVV